MGATSILYIQDENGDFKPVNVDRPLPTTATINGSLAKSFEQLTIDGTAGGIGLTAAKYSTHKKAFITVETASIRFTLDGATAPTATVGHLLNAGDSLELDSNENIVNFKAIRIGSTSAVISCTYSD